MIHLVTIKTEGDDGDYTLREWYFDKENGTVVCTNKFRNAFTFMNDHTWNSILSIESALDILNKHLKHRPQILRDIKLKLML